MCMGENCAKHPKRRQSHHESCIYQTTTTDNQMKVSISPSFWRHHKNIFLYHLLFPGISTQTQQQIRLQKGRKKSLFSLWFSSCTNHLVALPVLLCRHHYQPHTQAFTFYNHYQQKGRLLYVLLITNMIFVWQETTAPSGVVNAIHTTFFDYMHRLLQVPFHFYIALQSLEFPVFLQV